MKTQQEVKEKLKILKGELKDIFVSILNNPLPLLSPDLIIKKNVVMKQIELLEWLLGE